VISLNVEAHPRHFRLLADAIATGTHTVTRDERQIGNVFFNPATFADRCQLQPGFIAIFFSVPFGYSYSLPLSVPYYISKQQFIYSSRGHLRCARLRFSNVQPAMPKTRRNVDCHLSFSSEIRMLILISPPVAPPTVTYLLLCTYSG